MNKNHLIRIVDSLVRQVMNTTQIPEWERWAKKWLEGELGKNSAEFARREVLKVWSTMSEGIDDFRHVYSAIYVTRAAQYAVEGNQKGVYWEREKLQKVLS